MELFYRTYGQGKPLIILHGLFGLSDNWVTFARMMSADYQVFLPDLRNHGQSPRSNVMNYPAMAEDIKEFIAFHNILHPVIMGHSMGGKVAMQFALEYPEIPDKLIVVDISPGTYDIRSAHLEISGAMLAIDFDTVKSRKEIEDQIAGLVADPKIQLFILKNLYRPNTGRFAWRPNLDAITENLDFITEGITSNTQFRNPVLFVRGGKSDYMSDEDIPLIEKLFPLYSIKTIENASHWVHADAPVILHEMVSRFIS